MVAIKNFSFVESAFLSAVDKCIPSAKRSISAKAAKTLLFIEPGSRSDQVLTNG